MYGDGRYHRRRPDRSRKSVKVSKVKCGLHRDGANIIITVGYLVAITLVAPVATWARESTFTNVKTPMHVDLHGEIP